MEVKTKTRPQNRIDQHIEGRQNQRRLQNQNKRGEGRCYAHKEKDVGEDEFERHSLAVLNVIATLPEYNAVLDVVEKLGGNRTEVEAFIRLAAAAHDLGKINREYQGDCKAEKICMTYYDSAFPICVKGHCPPWDYSDAGARLLGLAYAKAVGNDDYYNLDLTKGNINRDVLYTMFVVIPVWLHHYDAVKYLRSPAELELDEECVGAAIDLLWRLDLGGVAEKVVEELKDIIADAYVKRERIKLPRLNPIAQYRKLYRKPRRDTAFDVICYDYGDCPEEKEEEGIRPDLVNIAENVAKLITAADDMVVRRTPSP